MTSISANFKNTFASSIRFLNQPLIKEGVKNVASAATFAFGVVELYDLYQIARGRKISVDMDLNAPQWVRVANLTILFAAKVSLVLSAGVSRPGIYLISSLIGACFSTAQLERAFGPNTIYAINPRHPRHWISLVAVAFALPSIAQSSYRGIYWLCKTHTQVGPQRDGVIVETWFTDRKIRLMAFFNTLTSRPTLHLGNQFGRVILSI